MPRNQGRHELGQNDLIDPRVISRITVLARDTDGPLVDWGAGDGALTLPLARLGRPVQGIEIDPRRAARLARRVGPHVCITEGDILRHAPPVGTARPDASAGNISTRETRAVRARCSHRMPPGPKPCLNRPTGSPSAIPMGVIAASTPDWAAAATKETPR